MKTVQVDEYQGGYKERQKQDIGKKAKGMHETVLMHDGTWRP